MDEDLIICIEEPKTSYPILNNNNSLYNIDDDSDDDSSNSSDYMLENDDL
jgi:hypothetical protein